MNENSVSKQPTPSTITTLEDAFLSVTHGVSGMTLAAFKRLCIQCKIHDLRVMNSDLEKVFKKYAATENNKFVNYDQF